MPDTALHPFHYSQRGRRPLLWLLLSLALALLALAAAVSAPVPVLVILTVAAAAALAALFRDRDYGMSITAQQVRIWGPRLDRSFSIARISHVAFMPCTDRATLHLRDGTTFEIPTRHLPTAEVLRHEFRRAGIACRDG